MQCKRCGAELKPGRMYCSSCGKEVQMVSGYGDLEDEYLSHLLREGSGSDTEENGIQKQQKGKTPPVHRKNNKVPVFVVCGLLAVLIIVAVSTKLYINYQNDNSYDYQVAMAEKEAAKGNDAAALSCYKTALSLEPQDSAVRFAMAKIYMKQQAYDNALVLYMEIIKSGHADEETYQNLITIYEKKGDYQSIATLADGITDEKLLALFSDYLVEPPVISPVSDTYNDYVSVGLYSLNDADIYYTLDGSSPLEEGAVLYREDSEIMLKKNGTYTVKAICKNAKGIKSEVAESVFVIALKAPGYAKVTPDGGRISEETQVVITAEPGCSIYYTWDGTQPDTGSAKYVSPIDIPSGNNILSVLVVNDKTNLDSGVYRTNFIYYP